MFSLLQFPFQGFLQCSMFFPRGNGLVIFAFKVRVQATAGCRGGVSESKPFMRTFASQVERLPFFLKKKQLM